eukprot:1004727-Alexandrium_andersonii.AAC.1
MSPRYGCPPDSAPRPPECSDAGKAGRSSAPRELESSMSASSRATPASGSTCWRSSPVSSNTAAPRPR